MLSCSHELATLSNISILFLTNIINLSSWLMSDTFFYLYWYPQKELRELRNVPLKTKINWASHIPILCANMNRLVLIAAATWCFVTFAFKLVWNSTASRSKTVWANERNHTGEFNNAMKTLLAENVCNEHVREHKFVPILPFSCPSHFAPTLWMNLRCFWLVSYSVEPHQRSEKLPQCDISPCQNSSLQTGTNSSRH